METSQAMVRMKVLNKHGVHLNSELHHLKVKINVFTGLAFLVIENTVHIVEKLSTFLYFHGVKKLSCTPAGKYIKTYALVGFSLHYLQSAQQHFPSLK